MQQLSSDFSLIEDSDARLHSAWLPFIKAMEGKAYGWDALHRALYIFEDSI